MNYSVPQNNYAHYCVLVMLSVCAVPVAVCAQNVNGQLDNSQRNIAQVANHGSPASNKPTNIAKDLFPWLSEALELKKHKVKYLHIANYDVSPDGRYMAVNISNETRDRLHAPFYRFVVVDARERRILFPDKELLLRDDKGYPYISVRFDNNNHAAIAYGMRTIGASVLSLSNGNVIKEKNLMCMK